MNTLIERLSSLEASPYNGDDQTIREAIKLIGDMREENALLRQKIDSINRNSIVTDAADGYRFQFLLAMMKIAIEQSACVSPSLDVYAKICDDDNVQAEIRFSGNSPDDLRIAIDRAIAGTVEVTE